MSAPLRQDGALPGTSRPLAGLPRLAGTGVPLRRNGDGVAPERGGRCAGTATPFYWNRRGLRLFLDRAHGYFGEMPGVGSSLSNRKRTSEKREITHAKTQRTQRWGAYREWPWRSGDRGEGKVINRVENVENVELGTVGRPTVGAAVPCRPHGIGRRDQEIVEKSLSV